MPTRRATRSRSNAARRPRQRRRAGDERADRACVAARRREVRRRGHRARPRRRASPPKPVFAVWVGESGRGGRSCSKLPTFPSYATESDAVYGFMHLVRYREARDLLMATPPSLPQILRPIPPSCGRSSMAYCADKRTWLDPIELTRVLFRLWHSGHAGRAGARRRRSGRRGKTVPC